MDPEIKSAVDYIMLQISQADVPPEALRALIEERIRMACAEALRWQAGCLQNAASHLTMRPIERKG